MEVVIYRRRLSICKVQRRIKHYIDDWYKMYEFHVISGIELYLKKYELFSPTLESFKSTITILF